MGKRCPKAGTNAKCTGAKGDKVRIQTHALQFQPVPHLVYYRGPSGVEGTREPEWPQIKTPDPLDPDHSQDSRGGAEEERRFIRAATEAQIQEGTQSSRD